jgi:hypothetical protein
MKPEEIAKELSSLQTFELHRVKSLIDQMLTERRIAREKSQPRYRETDYSRAIQKLREQHSP